MFSPRCVCDCRKYGDDAVGDDDDDDNDTDDDDDVRD